MQKLGDNHSLCIWSSTVKCQVLPREGSTEEVEVYSSFCFLSLLVLDVASLVLYIHLFEFIFVFVRVQGNCLTVWQWLWCLRQTDSFLQCRTKQGRVRANWCFPGGCVAVSELTDAWSNPPRREGTVVSSHIPKASITMICSTACSTVSRMTTYRYSILLWGGEWVC